MSLYLSNAKIGQIYLGSTKISEAYLGGAKVFSGAVRNGIKFNYAKSVLPTPVSLNTVGDYVEANVHLLLSSTVLIWIPAAYNNGKIGNSSNNAYYFRLKGASTQGLVTVNYTNLVAAPHKIKVQCSSVEDTTYGYDIYIDDVLKGSTTMTGACTFSQFGNVDNGSPNGSLILYSLAIKAGGEMLGYTLDDLIAYGDGGVTPNYEST